MPALKLCVCSLRVYLDNATREVAAATHLATTFWKMVTFSSVDFKGGCWPTVDFFARLQFVSYVAEVLLVSSGHWRKTHCLYLCVCVCVFRFIDIYAFCRFCLSIFFSKGALLQNQPFYFFNKVSQASERVIVRLGSRRAIHLFLCLKLPWLQPTVTGRKQ